MTTEDTKQSFKLFIVLSRAHKAINESTNQFFQQNGLNPTEFAVLELLFHKGQTTACNKLAIKFYLLAALLRM